MRNRPIQDRRANHRLVQTPAPCSGLYYESIPELPRGKLEADVAAFEARNGAIAGYTRGELIAIARVVRASIRQERRQQPEPNDQPVGGSPRKWEVWLTGIGFGVFILAAVGLFYYAISVEKLENWEG